MSDPRWTVLAVLALLVANAFFVAAEFALVRARGFRVEALASEGRFGARLTVQIQTHLEAYLAACQLGITMASLGLGWVGEPAVAAVLEPAFAAAGLSARTLHTVSFLVGFVAFSALHIVIGEQVPKTFAIRKAEPVALWIAYPLRGFYLLMYPLNRALASASAGILALFGVEQATHGEVLTDEELRGLVAVSREHGAIGEEKGKMLSNLFAFDERTVGRIMVPRGDVTVLDLAADPADNLRVVREAQHSRYPVVDDDPSAIVGIVLSKEVFTAMLFDGGDPWARLRDFVREPLVVPESLRIGRLFDSMRQQRAHMALVVDEYGDFVGLATLEDLLEEIVGEIVDETDPEEQKYTVEAHADGWVAHGLAPLADVERATALAVPPELDANTLSGLFMQRLGRMPAIGDALDEGGYRLEVVEMKGHRVERVAMRKLADHAACPDPPA